MNRLVLIAIIFLFFSFSFAFEKVNINTADECTIAKLPGVGRLIARRIVEYREKNGKFKKIEDLKKVKGIVNERYEAIKDKVYVDEREK